MAGGYFRRPTPLETDRDGSSTIYYHAVAIAAKGGAVFYGWGSDGESNKFCETFDVFSSLRDAVSEPRTNYAARTAMEKLGVPVEELDI